MMMAAVIFDLTFFEAFSEDMKKNLRWKVYERSRFDSRL